MFITRKRFLEELAKERKETEERIFQSQRVEHMQRYIDERIRELEREIWELRKQMIPQTNYKAESVNE